MLGGDGRRRVSGARNGLCSRQPGRLCQQILPGTKGDYTHEAENFYVVSVFRFGTTFESGFDAWTIVPDVDLTCYKAETNVVKIRCWGTRDRTKVECSARNSFVDVMWNLKITFRRIFFLYPTVEEERKRRLENRQTSRWNLFKVTSQRFCLRRFLITWCRRHII